MLVWDTATGDLVNTIQPDPGGMWINSAAYSPDAKTLAIGTQSGAIIIWDVAGNKALSTLPIQTKPSGSSRVTHIAFSPDGALLTAQIIGCAVELRDTRSWKVLTSIPGWGSAFSPDGKILAVMDGEKAVSLRNLDGLQKIGVLPFPSGRENMSDWEKGLDYSPDGTLLASGGHGSTVLLRLAQEFEQVQAEPAKPAAPSADLSYVFPQPLQAGKPLAFSRIRMMDTQNGWGFALDGKSQGGYPVSHLLQTGDGGQTWRSVILPGGKDTLVDTIFALDARTAWTAPHFTDKSDSVTGDEKSYDTYFTWRTTDGGKTWQQSQPVSLKSDAPDEFFPSVMPQMYFLDQQNGWLSVSIDCSAVGNCRWQVYQTTDGGMHWNRVGSSKSGPSNVKFFSSVIYWDLKNGWGASGGFHQYIENALSPVSITRDGGKTWLGSQELPKPATLSGAADLPEALKKENVACAAETIERIKPGAAGILAECSGSYPSRRVYYFTPDRGKTWQGWESSGESFISAAIGWRLAPGAAGQPARLLQTTDGAKTWKEISTVAWSGSLYFITNRIGWALARQSEATALLQTTDGGKTWVEVNPVFADGR